MVETLHDKFLEVGCTGLAKARPPEPCVVVIFGVSGDLARSTLIPSLYTLKCQGLLPEPLAIIGFARREWDDTIFRHQMRQFAEEEGDFDPDTWHQFAKTLYYARGTFDDPDAYAALGDKMTHIQAEHHIPDQVLFHLSTAPRFYGEIVRHMAQAGILQHEQGWRRVIIEKPFGHDATSARQLDRELLEIITEEQLYRVDHYLGKETIQNMLVFRFANPAFEPIWNRHYVDHVQITAAETKGIGTRAGYYESMGVVRDMLQNHLLHLLCMTAMESPVFYDAISLRHETFKVLQAIKPVDPKADCVLGQYDEGKIEGEAVCAYRQEANVADDAKTPTFVALKLEVDNTRWAGVPFYLRTGKRLPQKLTEVTVQFKPMPHFMFPLESGTRLPANTLTFRLQPDEGIIQTFLAKQPGPGMCLRPVRMTFRYDAAFGIETLPNAYAWLLLDAMHGDQTLFPRSDWIDQAWSIVDPLNDAWETTSPTSMPTTYPSGSWGPQAADALIEQDGHAWRVV